ncbi:hypothetical protein MMC25_003705 [Agyrium rufum]|nr:hypothetical protein [Agyrium rufum]
MAPYKTAIYFVNWAIYARNHNVQDLPSSLLTHIIYAFANVRPETGEVYLTDTWSDTDKHYPGDSWQDQGTNVYGCIKQLYLLKKKNRHVKTLLSVGGWTYSANFAQPAGSVEGRRTFTKSAVKLVSDLGFDGLDIDWEYPKDEKEGRDFVELLKVCREELDAWAARVGPEKIKNLDLTGMNEYLDLFNLMAYDYAGSFSSVTAHSANLSHSPSNRNITPFSTSEALDLYLPKVPSKKILLGLPLYGRAFGNTKGMGHPFTPAGAGSWEAGVWDWKALPKVGAMVEQDKSLGASWSFDEGVGEVVSFDSPEIMDVKVSYLREKGLGGAMWWESSGDRKVGEGSAAERVIAGLDGNLDMTSNCLDYPDSKYDNLRRGMSS